MFAASFDPDPILRALGSFLVVEDRLQPAAAIIPLAGEGEPPLRELEAARLYRAGWAPLVIVVRKGRKSELENVRPVSTRPQHPSELTTAVLIREGVPASAIRIMDDDAKNTLQELQAAFRGIPSKNAPVILVTSKQHTLRARLTWDYVTSSRSPAIVRPVGRDSFDPTRWWQQREFARSVAHEYLGLINYYAGFPISGRGALNQSQ
jgi:uncharacterized SAM-binding protein YcdF (DUF218 family)